MLSLFLTSLRLLKALWHGLKQRTFRAILFLYSVILLSGTLFYHSIEGWPWLDALLFSVATLSTAHLTDLTPATDIGKIFTVIFMLVGVGVFFALAAYIAKILIAPPDKNKPK